MSSIRRKMEQEWRDPLDFRITPAGRLVLKRLRTFVAELHEEVVAKDYGAWHDTLQTRTYIRPMMIQMNHIVLD